MKALDTKLWRDLGRVWGQAITIALVVACGIASFVAMQSAYDSLLVARDRYYEDRRFASMFVHLERAPESMARRIEEIPGVARVHTRVVREISLPIADLPEPAVGRIVSLPRSGQPPLNAIQMRKGRLVEPGHPDEVVVIESFAKAHHLEPGAVLPAVINGTWRQLRVVGVAVSPEYVFAVGGASFVQDDRRFAVLWMDRDGIAPAFRMEGSFDDVVLELQPGASEPAVDSELRRLLAPYGVVSSTGRAKQLSNHVLDGELGQLRQFARVTPLMFLTVAAFLVNVVLGRLLHLQRSQIATLRAIGYRRSEVALHYLELVAVIVGLGAVLGVALGAFLGQGMLELYRPYFRFAALDYRLSPAIALTAVGVSVAAGTAGALQAVIRAARLPPAEAMQPEAPPIYRRSLLDRAVMARIFGVAGRMVLREIVRRPVRTLLSCLGIAMATAVVGGARFTYDAMDLLLSLQFERAQREDAEVTFRRPVSADVVREISHWPGVEELHPHRVVPIRAHFEQRARDTALVGFADAAVPLRGVARWPVRSTELSESGVIVSEQLSRALGAVPGDVVRFEILEGSRRAVDVRIERTVPDAFGMLAYASLPSVQRLLGEAGNVSSVLVRINPNDEEAFVERAKGVPIVASVSRRRELLRQFSDQASHVWVTTTILTLFGAIIAFGVVYNHARIALSVRARDLASLRVLGFTRGEVSGMLLAEIALYVAAGTPVGLVLGKGLVLFIVSTIDPETYRFPAYVSARTYAFGALVTALSALASALLVRRRLDHLDLASVLKTRE